MDMNYVFIEQITSWASPEKSDTVLSNMTVMPTIIQWTQISKG